MYKQYLRFLRLARALNQNKNIVKDVDATAMLLLNEIAIQHLDDKPIQASEMGSVQTKNCATVFLCGVLKLLGWGFLLHTPPLTATAVDNK